MDYLDEFIHKDLIKRELEHSRVYRYLDKYMTKDIFQAEELGGNESVRRNHTIWILWMDGLDKAPRLVQKCYESMCRNKPEDYDIVLLTGDILEDYIRLPDYIWRKYREGYISTPQLSDIIRIELLCTYGGCWADATVFSSSPIPRYMLKKDMFLFKTSSMDSIVLKMSSWWLAGSRDNRIFHAVRKMLHAFWKQENDVRDYYLFHITMSKVIDEDPVCRSIYDSIPYFNNGNPHVLFRKFAAEFDEEEWEIIKDISVIHKLTNKERYLRGDVYNYYQALLDDRLR